MTSYRSDAVDTTTLSPRRERLCRRVLDGLAPWPAEVDAKDLAERIGCERHDVLLALDDLWTSGRISMRMIGDVLIAGREVEHG